MLTSRQLELLKVIIDDFINNAIPVGSKTLRDNYELPYSSATIRNEMATLEELGLLEKTHTSSGRIPSNRGYRFYVDYLLEYHEIDDSLQEKIECIFNNRKLEIEDIVKETCDLIASMTNYTSIALGTEAKDEVLAKIDLVPLSNNSVIIVIATSSGKVESKIFNIPTTIDINDLDKALKVINNMIIGCKLSEIVDRIENDIKPELAKYIVDYEDILNAFINAFIKFSSDYVYVGGRNNIINLPDFNDISKIRTIVNIMDDKDFFDMLATNMDKTSVKIGKENDIINIDDISVVTSEYQISNNEKGIIAIVGPTRMDYDKVIHILDYVSKKISQLKIEKRGENEDE